MKTQIHPSTTIDPSAQIGVNVDIGPNVYIGKDVIIGDGCKIYPHTYIEFTEMGKECVVFPQVSLGTSPQHLLYKGESTRLKIGSRNVFRESVTAHRGTMLDRGVTTIGDDCFFMALSHIAHDCKIGDSVIMANSAQLAGHVEIGDRCFISTMVGIHQFVRIGTGAIVSGGAMVPMDVAPYCMAQGDRAKLKGLNLVGMKRAGMKRDSVKAIKEAYQIVFHSGLRLEEALQHAHFNTSDPALREFKKFLSVPKRGFIRPGETEEE